MVSILAAAKLQMHLVPIHIFLFIISSTFDNNLITNKAHMQNVMSAKQWTLKWCVTSCGASDAQTLQEKFWKWNLFFFCNWLDFASQSNSCICAYVGKLWIFEWWSNGMYVDRCLSCSCLQLLKDQCCNFSYYFMIKFYWVKTGMESHNRYAHPRSQILLKQPSFYSIALFIVVYFTKLLYAKWAIF